MICINLGYECRYIYIYIYLLRRLLLIEPPSVGGAVRATGDGRAPLRGGAAPWTLWTWSARRGVGLFLKENANMAFSRWKWHIVDCTTRWFDTIRWDSTYPCVSQGGACGWVHWFQLWPRLGIQSLEIECDILRVYKRVWNVTLWPYLAHIPNVSFCFLLYSLLQLATDSLFNFGPGRVLVNSDAGNSQGS